MGIKRLDEEKDHWSSDDVLKTVVIKRSMSRNRYLDIKKRIHFCDEDLSDKSDPIYKIRYLLNNTRDKAQQLYQPSKQLSIDESLIAFKVRFIFIQYLSKKSSKFGIKFYVLAESKTGFMINWICFSGKIEGNGSQTENIVNKLLECIPEQTGHEIYCDNFYTSIPLAESLSERGFAMTGTIRQNRVGLPLEYKKRCFKIKQK